MLKQYLQSICAFPFPLYTCTLQLLPMATNFFLYSKYNIRKQSRFLKIRLGISLKRDILYIKEKHTFLKSSNAK